MLNFKNYLFEAMRKNSNNWKNMDSDSKKQLFVTLYYKYKDFDNIIEHMTKSKNNDGWGLDEDTAREMLATLFYDVIGEHPREYDSKHTEKEFKDILKNKFSKEYNQAKKEHDKKV